MKKDDDGICTCKKQTKFINITRGYQQYCSYQCSSNSNQTIIKRKETNQKKYGCDNVSQSEIVKSKRISTFQTRFGVSHPMKNPDVIDKNKNTWRNHSFKKYKEILDKTQKTNIKNHGGLSPASSPEVLKKIQRTNLDRYGGKSPYSSPLIRNKGCDTSILNFGVDNYAKTSEFRELARNNLIDAMEHGLKDGDTFSPRMGKNEEIILNEFEELSDFMLPVRGCRLCGYFPDARNDDLNIIVEIYEKWHNRVYWIDHDKKRKYELEQAGYHVFIIWEDIWLNDKNSVLIEFSNFLNNIGINV